MAATASLSVPQAAPSGLSHMQPGPSAKRTKLARGPPRVSIGEINPNNIGTLRKLHAVLFPVAYSDRFYKEVLAPELEDYCKLVYYNDIPVGAICCRIERDPVASGSGSRDDSNAPSTGRLYLMTLGVLAPYRRRGLASKLLTHVIEKATENSLAASLTPSHQTPIQAPTAPAPSKPVAKTAKGKNKAAAIPSVPSIKGKETEKNKDADKEPEAEKKETPPAPPLPVLKKIFVHVQTSNDDAKLFWETKGFVEAQTIKDYYKPNIVGPRDAWLLEKELDM